MEITFNCRACCHPASRSGDGRDRTFHMMVRDFVRPDYLTNFATKIEERQHYDHAQTHQLRDRTHTHMLFQRLIRKDRAVNFCEKVKLDFLLGELDSANCFSLQRVGEKQACPKISTTAITAMLCSPTLKHTHHPRRPSLRPRAEKRLCHYRKITVTKTIS